MSPPRRARMRKTDITELQWAFLNDALDEDDPRRHEPEHRWRFYELFCNCTLADRRPIVDGLWQAYGRNVVARWAQEKPGTRPSLWWVYDAPRAPAGLFGCLGDGELPNPRRRLGGIGTPRHECLDDYPSFRFGVPSSWITAREVELYSGQARDARGNRIMHALAGKPFEGVAIDPNDPPLYEAQASYLERHGLLLPGERKRLAAGDFKPEAVPPPAY